MFVILKLVLRGKQRIDLALEATDGEEQFVVVGRGHGYIAAIMNASSSS